MSLFPKYIFWLSFSLFAVIALAPLGQMFADALAAYPFWKAILLDGRQMMLLCNSLVIAGFTVLGAFFLGVPLAFLIAKTDMLFKRFFSIVFLLPMFFPSYITTIGWTKLLSKTSLAASFYSTAGVVFILSISYFPFMMLLVLSGLYSLNSGLEEAGLLLYPARKIFKDITLPLLFPYVFSGAIFVFIFSISNYGVPDQLRVVTYPVEIFTQFSAFYDAKKATLLSLPIVIITLFLILLQQRFMGSKSYVTFNIHRRQRFIVKLGRKKIIILFFCVLVFIVSVVIPLVVLLSGAGPLSTYAAVFKTSHQQIVNSFILACISATIILVVGFPLAYMFQRANRAFSQCIDIVSLIPFAVPATILGIGLITLWNKPATNFIYKTCLVVIFAHTARFIAFGIRIMSADIGLISKNMEEQAALVCKNWPKRFAKIFLPLNKRGFFYAWIACFALSIGELEATLLVTPAGEATLPIRIYTLLHYGMHKLVFGLCVILIGLVFIPLILAAVFQFISRNTNRSGYGD